jgi:hypothetical protein
VIGVEETLLGPLVAGAKEPVIELHEVEPDPQRVTRTKHVVAQVWRAIAAGHFFPSASPQRVAFPQPTCDGFAQCAASGEAAELRDDLSYFQYIQAALKKQEGGSGKTPEQLDAAVWRKRWKADFTQSVSVECTEPRDGLRKAILAVFADEHRSGRPARIKAEQQAQLVALTCEHPNPVECPVAHRSSEDLAREAVKRGIVDSISARHLRDILECNDMRPHRLKH